MSLSFTKFRMLSERKRLEPTLYDELKPYSNDPAYFVTFTAIEKVGINPSNAFSTPIGIYAYSLKDLWKHWIAGNFFFGRDRPYVNLLKVNTTKILHLKNYSFNTKDLSILQARYDSVKNVTDLSFEAFLKDTRAATAKETNLYSNNSDGAVLWNLTFRIARKLASDNSKAFTVRWNTLFRELGYDAIYDTSSIIHLLQSSQAVFFTPSSYKLVGRFKNKNLIVNDSDYWGTKEQPFWYPGENPAVDIAITTVIDTEKKVLLVKRKQDGSWALPGSFIHTDSEKGEPFNWGRETPKQAAIRVLTEKTKLYLGGLRSIGEKIRFVGKFDSKTKDSRNNKEAWSASYFFTIHFADASEIDLQKIGAQAEASDAKWFALNEVPKLAFGHNGLIRKVL